LRSLFWLILSKNRDCAPTQQKTDKNNRQRFGDLKKIPYLCKCYPENNLFTLKELIPIEDMKRSPVRAIALFFYIPARLFIDVKR
jgi:hypothetical protein